MSEYKVIDNFLKEKDFEIIKEVMLGPNFGWYLNDYIVQENKKSSNLTDYQLTHHFYDNETVNSDFFKFLKPILDIINPTSLIRIKANLLPHTSENVLGGWHKDVKIKCKTAVFYLNTNNGYTVFKDSGEKIESVANRFVSFDSNMEHSGATCTDAKVRCLINFNYI
jgi:hypothetical protein